MASKNKVRKALRLSPPKKPVFAVAVILFVLGVLIHFTNVPLFHRWNLDFWFVGISAFIQIIGCLFAGI